MCVKSVTRTVMGMGASLGLTLLTSSVNAGAAPQHPFSFDEISDANLSRYEVTVYNNFNSPDILLYGFAATSTDPGGVLAEREGWMADTIFADEGSPGIEGDEDILFGSNGQTAMIEVPGIGAITLFEVEGLFDFLLDAATNDQEIGANFYWFASLPGAPMGAIPDEQDSDDGFVFAAQPDTSFFALTTTVTAVPEPTAILILGGSLIGLGVLRQRRRRAA